jgi:hypothetical protein
MDDASIVLSAPGVGQEAGAGLAGAGGDHTAGVPGTDAEAPLQVRLRARPREAQSVHSIAHRGGRRWALSLTLLEMPRWVSDPSVVDLAQLS